MRRTLYGAAHEEFRDRFREFAVREIASRVEHWNRAGTCDREIWRLMGKEGLLGLAAPTEYGGSGLDLRYDLILTEELARIRAHGLMVWLHSAVALPYLLAYGSEELKRAYVPPAIRGERILAVALSEPHAGSDLGRLQSTARLRGDRLVLRGTKAFISNARIANLFVVAARLPDASGISLVLVPGDAPGLERKPLHKLGLPGQGTSNLHFRACRIPADHVLGRPGHGMRMILERLHVERLCLSAASLASCARMLEDTMERIRRGGSDGGRARCSDAGRIAVAELATGLEAGWAFLDRVAQRQLRGNARPQEIAMLKWWTASLHLRFARTCLDLYGREGILADSLAGDYADAAVQPIHGGTNEIMKLLIARRLGLS